MHSSQGLDSSYTATADFGVVNSRCLPGSAGAYINDRRLAAELEAPLSRESNLFGSSYELFWVQPMWTPPMPAID
jgi:hypothetical protein